MANRKPTSFMLVVLIAVAVATVIFIIANSLQSSAGSWSVSNAVAALLEPVLRRVYGAVGSVMSWMGLPAITYGVFVRKLAHFCEYFVLGVECTALTAAVVGRAVSPYVWMDLFIVLAVGVVDEFVQAVVGRSSLISDVLLDFSGAAAGIAITLLIASIVIRHKRAGRHAKTTRPS